MRLLHTADWHIGQLFYGYDRSTEHLAAFRALRAIVAEKQPDVLLVSGDIFHNPQPSASAQALLTRVITELRDAAPEMAVVMTAGNHDSASRHEIFSEAWKRIGVYAVGSVADFQNPDFAKLIIELPSGYVIAVPYLYGRAIDEGLFPRLLAEVEKRNTACLPVVAMAHAMLQFPGVAPGDDFKGADEPKAPELFGSGYDYLALGHVHHPSAMPGTAGTVRYSGSLIPVSFAEDFTHSVVLADIPAHGAPVNIELLPLPDVFPVVSIPANGFRPYAEALAELKQYNPAAPCYVRLCVNRDEAVPADAAETATGICEEKGIRFCHLHYPPQSWTGGASDGASLSFDEFREMTPREVADLYMQDCGFDFPESLKLLFDEIVESVNQDEQ